MKNYLETIKSVKTTIAETHITVEKGTELVFVPNAGTA